MANINEAFPSKFLKASDLQGRTVPVTIDRVEFEPVGQSREIKPIVYFDGKEKGLPLNKTNAGKIIQISGSTETDDWHGVRVALYPTETSFQGEQVECVRIKAVPSAKAAARPVAPVEPEFVDGEDPIPF